MYTPAENLSMLKTLTADDYKSMVLSLAYGHPEIFAEIFKFVRAVNGANISNGTAVDIERTKEQIREMVSQNLIDTRKIAAIKACRELCNIGLKEAKDWVECRMPEYRPDHMEAYYANVIRESIRTAKLSGSGEVHQYEKVMAVKKYRSLTGASLKDAIRWVEKNIPECCNQ